MSTLRISVLGSPAVCWDDVPVMLPGPRAYALLYRLAVQDEPIPREHIGFLFWPRRSESIMRRYVTQLCRQLRHALPEPDAVVLEERAIGLEPSLVWSDAIRFYQLAADCRRRPEVRKFVALTDLYRGPLLCGFSLTDCREYEAWIAVARRLWRRDFLSALHGLVEQALLEKEFAIAAASAQRYLNASPLNEEMHRCLIGLYGLQGDKNAADKQYRTCLEALRRKTGRLPQLVTTETHRAATDGTLHRRHIVPILSSQPLLPSRDTQRRQLQYESKPRRQKLLLF